METRNLQHKHYHWPSLINLQLKWGLGYTYNSGISVEDPGFGQGGGPIGRGAQL